MLKKISLVASFVAALGLAIAISAPADAKEVKKTVHVNKAVHVNKTMHVNKTVTVHRNVRVNRTVRSKFVVGRT